MKKFSFVFGIIAMIMFAFGFSACEKDADFQKMVNDPECSDIDMNTDVDGTRGSNSYFGWTYYPNTSYSYSYSSSYETKQGYGGTYYGGFMEAELIDNGGTYYVRLTPANGSTFGVSGNAYIKVGSLYASYGTNTASFSSNYSYVDVPVSIPLNKNNTSKRGVMNLWPVIITSSGTRYFTYPILIWTNPLCNTYTNTNALQGYVDNVPVKEVPGGCVAFCKSYYSTVYGMNLNGMGNACDWPGNASSNGLTFYSNGTTEPQVGDIVCWSGGTGTYAGYGHIAIIFEVNSSWIKIAQQGRGNMAPIGYQLSRSGTNGMTLVNSIGSSYTLTGVIRKN